MKNSNAIAYSIKQLHDKDNPVVPWCRAITYKLIKEGKLRKRKVGRRTIILDTDLRDCIENLTD
jgi:hypothetical protein